MNESNTSVLYSCIYSANNLTMWTKNILALGLCLPLLCAAASEERWQLDLVAFERLQSERSGFSETWTFKPITWPQPLLALAPAMPSMADADTLPLYITGPAREQGIQILSAQGSRLFAAGDKLRRSGRYRILSQHSLRFAQKTRTPKLELRGSQALRLVARDTRQAGASMMDYWLSQPDLAPPMDAEDFFGWVQLDHAIHPILQFDVSLLLVLPGVLPNEVDPDGRQEYFRDQVQQFRLQQERRLRPGLTAYFDHPKLGLLARLTAVATVPEEDPAAEDTTADTRPN